MWHTRRKCKKEVVLQLRGMQNFAHTEGDYKKQ